MIRKAKMSDAGKIKGLLEGYSKKGLLLDRSLFGIYESLRDFFVFKEKGEIVGCCALHFCWENLAEIRSLAVDEKFNGKGFGKELVQSCLEDAKGYGIEKVFTLTFVPNFFKGLEFEEIEKDKLPQKIWNDCLNCPHFPNCTETAMQKQIK